MDTYCDKCDTCIKEKKNIIELYEKLNKEFSRVASKVEYYEQIHNGFYEIGLEQDFNDILNKYNHMKTFIENIKKKIDKNYVFSSSTMESLFDAETECDELYLSVITYGIHYLKIKKKLDIINITTILYVLKIYSRQIHKQNWNNYCKRKRDELDNPRIHIGVITGRIR